MFHVKPFHTHFTPDEVTVALSQAGVQASPDQASKLAAHAELVLKLNERLNLTRIVDHEDVLVLHIVDSLAFVPLIGPLRGNVLDIGSGAGFPGIPLAIMGHSVSLCESIRKKAAALEEIVGALALTVTVFPRRAEELAASSPAAFDVVTARAVSGLGALIELAAPLLSQGGRLVALKGMPEAQETERADRVAEICGMSLVSMVRYELPRGEARTVFEYRKVARAKIELPRRPGLAQRAPLGE